MNIVILGMVIVGILGWFYPSSFIAALGWLNAAYYFYLATR
jgi:hypothetical protein